MRHRIALNPPRAGAHYVSRWQGLGIPGAEIPTTGDHDGSPLADDDILPGAEYRLVVITRPSAGKLTVYPDTSYDLVDAPDGSYSLTYQAWENSVIYGSAADVLTVGAVNATAPGGTGVSTGSGSGGIAVGTSGGDASAPGGTGVGVGSGNGGAAQGVINATAPGGTGTGAGSGHGGIANQSDWDSMYDPRYVVKSTKRTFMVTYAAN